MVDTESVAVGVKNSVIVVALEAAVDEDNKCAGIREKRRFEGILGI